MSPAGVATPMLSYADSDEGVGRGLQQALLPTEGKIARERESSHFGSSVHTLYLGVCAPPCAGGERRGVALGCTPEELPLP